MTVIFGATYDGGVVIGADSLGHDDETREPFPGRVKVHRVNDLVYGAKAGYGPDADDIWEELRNVAAVQSMGPSEIADHAHRLGLPIYHRCQLRAKSLGRSDVGLYMLIAGMDIQKVPHLHYLNFKTGEFLELECSAFGPSNTHSLANELLEEEKETELDITNWATKLVDRCIASAPHAIGYPVHLYMIEAEGVVHEEIPEGGVSAEPA